ncbi:MAG: hypothetical protein KJ914_01570 [Gammaproteobacteria bacterium]|nr:hypothetical protein [Gammaproteobacteria bacterium]MBU1723990.1 hypothetical protein [Gammaproteobacteria bacterium]MBU2005541.1 hypothetical protein [Gammaproteobacteria bacterium]
MQFSAYALLLYPVSETSVPLLPLLQAQAFVGAELEAGIYASGAQFLQHICFLGCSPDIELEPHASKPFCYVRLPVDDAITLFQPIRKPLLQLRRWVMVGNVHEAEAVPDAALLSALETASACRWKFAYLKP